MQMYFLCLFFACFSSFCLFWFILFYYCALNVCFLSKDRKGVHLVGRRMGEELGGVRERETITRLYCVKKNLFSVKEKMSLKKS